MSRPLRFALFLLALIPAAVWAKDGADGKATPDLSTPKAAAKVFAKGLSDNDIAAVRAASVGTEEDYQFYSRLGEVMAASRNVLRASVDRFGESEGKKIAEGLGVGDDAEAGLEKSEVKVQGDGATIYKKDDPEQKNPLRLKKVGGAWKVDLGSVPAIDKRRMREAMPGFPLIRKVMNDVAGEIKAGKYKTVDDARKAIDDKVAAAIAAARNGRRN